uniref:Lon N-terminal domain-containing protein n=1 Tax=Florenciella parvula TaxID=236787 RepID=A0A7S2BYL4_9STRA|mmetsp:Transcript_2226/g.4955  ORF Transcript_2226/g.4955 Transcript_2226/m.4955 type:complete len:599 (+) Transcript_2226:63-1859(+)
MAARHSTSRGAALLLSLLASLSSGRGFVAPASTRLPWPSTRAMARGAGSQLAMKDKPVGTTPEVQSLKNMFYADVSSSASVDDMGVVHDLPLWRVQWTELPGFQNVLNVHQPHYTHMFEKIVRGPEPWYFGHVYLPGGTSNLGKQDFKLSRGSKASLVGTLMQVRDLRTLEDGRQQIVVQALQRMVVVNETTGENPYSVGTVQLLPDMEQTMAHERRLLAEGLVKPAEVRTLARACTIGESLSWAELSCRKVAIADGSGGGISQLIPFDAVEEGSQEAADRAVEMAIRCEERSAWLVNDLTEGTTGNGGGGAGGDGGGASGDKGGACVVDMLFGEDAMGLNHFETGSKGNLEDLMLADGLLRSGPANGQSRNAMGSGSGSEGVADGIEAGGSGVGAGGDIGASGPKEVDAPTAEAEPRLPDWTEANVGVGVDEAKYSVTGGRPMNSVEQAEYDLWTTLDTMIRLLNELNPAPQQRIPMPSQFIGLLPQAPIKPWPLGFVFAMVVEKLIEAKAQVGTASKSPFVLTDSVAWPILLRAERLSHVASSLLEGGAVEQELGPNGVPFRQQLLETAGTAARLRLVREKVEAVNGLLRSHLEKG